MTDAHASLRYVLFQSQTMASKRGRSLGDTVRNVLEALLTKSFARKCNWVGAHNKVALRNYLNFYNVLSGECLLQKYRLLTSHSTLMFCHQQISAVVTHYVFCAIVAVAVRHHHTDALDKEIRQIMAKWCSNKLDSSGWAATKKKAMEKNSSSSEASNSGDRMDRQVHNDESDSPDDSA